MSDTQATSNLFPSWGGSRRGRHEHGTVLLMVVGVLALLSIIAVAYVSIGQTDRRGSTVLVRATRLDDQRDAVRDYIAGIIGGDVFSTIQDPLVRATPGDDGVYRTIRAAWDYPSTDEFRREARYRTPTDPRIPTTRTRDEFLVVSRRRPNSADTQKYVFFTPTGHGDDPWLASSKPSYIEPQTPNAADPADPLVNERFRDVRSWAHITNIAPDGLFVNLGTLRPTIENQYGNFYASSGTDAAVATGSADPSERSVQMSWGLSLFNSATKRLFDPRQVNQRRLADGRVADLRIPAHWSNAQYLLHRPANELDFSNGADGPESLRYLPYQFADADGDGFFDSRWFELSNGQNGAAVVPGLSFSGPARLFCAARIIDLSGRVNVNTATDFKGAGGAQWTGPEQAFPAGGTPADIDLGRVLRLVDGIDAVGAGSGYDAMLHRIPGTLAATPTPSSDYSGYDTASGYDASALSEGEYAFNNIWQSNLGVTTASPDIGGLERTAAYNLFGKDPAAARFHAEMPVGNTDQFTLGTPFDNSDLLELLTRESVNDPTHTSRLETLVDGKDIGVNADGPMRSNRPLSIELGYRTVTDVAAGTLNQFGLAQDTALIQTSLDIRSILTTISGHRPIMASDLAGHGGASGQSIADSEVAINAVAALRDASSITSNPLRDAASQRVFLAYVNALMPALPIANPPGPGNDLNDEAWIFGGAQFEQLQTQFYGWRGPELALRLSAFMTANLIDATDPGTGTGTPPSTHRQRGFVLYPSRNSFTTIGSGLFTDLNLDDIEVNVNGVSQQRLAPSVVAPTLPENIRVFGTEAQPFIVQMASYTMYTDAPPTGSPTGEPDEGWQWTDDGSGSVDAPPVDTINYGQVTIDGSISATNRDFLFQVVAFQLHNPFGYDVNLSGYTLQYGASRFPLPTTLGANILAAGETRTYYATNPGNEPLIAARWAQAAAPPVAGGPATPAFKTWLDRQLSLSGAFGTGGGPGAPIKLQTRIALDGTVVPPTDVRDLLADRASANNLANFAAFLWRRLDGGTTTPPPGSVNDELLADRLRDPKFPNLVSAVGTDRSTLDRRMSTASTIITGTRAGPDPRAGNTPNLAEADDNTGFTITMWGSVRRPVDPNADPASPTIPRGGFGAFCMEVKDQVGTGARWGSLNKAENDGVNDPGAPDEAEFTNGTDGGTTLAAVLSSQSGAASVPLIESITREPKNKRINGESAVRRSGDTLGAIDPVINPRLEYQTRYPEIHLNNKRFEEAADFDGAPPTGGPLPNTTYTTMRIGDTLLPMAIGAWWEPRPSAVSPLNQPPGFGYADLARIDEEWTTLSEALALAMDYDSPRQNALSLTGMYTGDRRVVFHRFGRDIVDRGQLRLDRFVPFYNGGPALQDVDLGVVATAPTDPASVISFPGIPLALNVLEQFRGLEYGSANSKINGTINLNTASRTAARALPMLTPDKNGWMTFAQMATGPGAGVGTRALYDPVAEHYDVAATLEAYRDKSLVDTRSTGLAAGGTATLAIDFRDVGTDPLVPLDGRRQQTQIPGIREEPGLRSVGEVLCAALNNPAHPVTVLTDAQRHDNSVDRFARLEPSPGEKYFFDQRSTTNADPLTGLDSTSYRVGATGTLDRPDQIPGDWDKKLTIANAVLNSVSVRSDVFCCWFIVQGYLPSDVEGFTTDQNDVHYRDAMVPSIQRRFMMVVDRSNVKTTSDKPRILLMKEVPM